MAETKGITQYEVEVQKQKTKGVIGLRVAVIRGPRGKQKLVGEASTKTSEHPYIYFKVINADDESGVYSEFLRLLVHRGYLPLQVREVKGGRKLGWKPVDVSGIEGIQHVLEQEGVSEKKKKKASAKK